MSANAERGDLTGRLALPFVLLAWLLASVAVRHAILFRRPVWLDEYHTVLVASRATPAQVVADLAAGVDLAPPLLHLVTWSLRLAVGALTPAVLHAASFLAVASALVLVYATLRRSFDRVSAVAGVLAVGSHALVVSHAFEARYYGPWLTACAFFCWAMGHDASAARSRTRDALVAVAAVLVCTIHWFGAVTLVLMCLGAGVALAITSRSTSVRAVLGALRPLYPALTGAAALAVCLPLLSAQRSHFNTPIWVPDLNSDQLVDMARSFYLAFVPVAALLILLASTFSERAPGAWRPRDALRDPGASAMAALALMPVAVVLISALVQPAMLPRYAIATALAWGPLVAMASRVLRPSLRAAWCVLLAGVWWLNLSGEAAAKAEFAATVDADTRAFDAARASGVPIVFQSRHVLYPVAARREANRGDMSLLMLPDSLLVTLFPPRSDRADLVRFFRFEHDAVRLHRAQLGFPRLVDVGSLDREPRFVLIGSDASLPRGYKEAQRFARAVFPGFRATRVSDHATLFTRQ